VRRPQIDLPDLASVVVELDSVDVDEAEVDGTLEELRDRLTTRPPLDDAFASRWGDFASLPELRCPLWTPMAGR
jgi:FKBP-type peptidyl-prolyl cis-trans isomerase (trigger factor)